jgi:hypothetical protein
VSIFLDSTEMHDLTGYVRHADQRRWLTDRGWTFEQNANGRPIVLRSHAESRMGGDTGKQAEKRPNFTAIKKAA